MYLLMLCSYALMQIYLYEGIYLYLMSLINARIDDKLLKDFRHVVYVKYGLKKGDLTRALEEAIRDYVQKNSESAKTNTP